MQGLNRTIKLTQRTLLAQLNILRRGRNLLSPFKTKVCSVWWLNLPAGDCNIVPFSVPQQLKRWKSMTTNRILLRISAIVLHSYYYYFISSTLSNIEYDEDEGRCSLPHLGWWVSTWMEGFGRFVPWFRGFQQSSSHLDSCHKIENEEVENWNQRRGKHPVILFPQTNQLMEPFNKYSLILVFLKHFCNST